MRNWDWCSLPGTLSSSPRWREGSGELPVDADMDKERNAGAAKETEGAIRRWLARAVGEG
jgi:hypothetical protein